MFNLFRKKINDVKKSEVQVTPEYIEWRKKILTFPPTGNLKGIPDEVYGLLMDVGMGDERGHFLAISIYAFNTGEASLKASSGAGIVGLGNSESVLGMPERIIESGQSLISLAKPANSFDCPKANEVQFSFITTAGVRVYECNLSELQNGHPFYNIFNMFTEIKSAADKLSKLLPLADVVNKIKK